MIFDLIKHAKQLLFDDSNANTGSNNVQGAIDKHANIINSLFNTKHYLKDKNYSLRYGVSERDALFTATKDCIVSISGYASYFASSVGTRNTALKVGGVYVWADNRQPTSSAITTNVPIFGVYKMKAGETLEIELYHTDNTGEGNDVLIDDLKNVMLRYGLNAVEL